MVLMIMQPGIPTRVVVSFHPAPDADVDGGWQVRGIEAYVWAEAFLEGADWVSSDSTPDRNRVLNSEDPQSKPKPKPRVDPPPTPPECVENETVVIDQREVNFNNPKDQPPGWVQAVIVTTTSAGDIPLLLSPLIAITTLKGRRVVRRCKKSEVVDRVTRARGEAVDRARDLGFMAVMNHTRREPVGDLQGGYPDLPIRPMVDQVGSSVFGLGEPEMEVHDSVWKQGGGLKSSLLATKPWYAWPAVFFSPKLLRRTGMETERHSWKPQASDRSGRNEDSIGELKK